jgi:hypothetical protein
MVIAISWRSYFLWRLREWPTRPLAHFDNPRTPCPFEIMQGRIEMPAKTTPDTQPSSTSVSREADRPAPNPDGHAPEFDRFHSLSRKLVNVPKSELDEKRRESS